MCILKATAELLQCGVSIFASTIPGTNVAAASPVIIIYCLILLKFYSTFFALILEKLEHDLGHTTSGTSAEDEKSSKPSVEA